MCLRIPLSLTKSLIVMMETIAIRIASMLLANCIQGSGYQSIIESTWCIPISFVDWRASRKPYDH